MDAQLAQESDLIRAEAQAEAELAALRDRPTPSGRSWIK
jgi:hypothetical protein